MANPDLLVRWLNDAYAREHQLIPVLENHANDVASSDPSSAQRIRQHIDETRRHAERLDAWLDQQLPSVVRLTIHPPASV